MAVTFPVPEGDGPGQLLRWARTLVQVLKRQDAQEKAAGTILPGALMPMSAGAVPQGWLKADGSLVNRTDYPQLFAAIGTTYNTGGEAGTQFRLPSGALLTHGFWLIKQ